MEIIIIPTPLVVKTEVNRGSMICPRSVAGEPGCQRKQPARALPPGETDPPVGAGAKLGPANLHTQGNVPWI